ncbi:MAG: hypothetical protein V4541_01255 [Bacteroidota bacterium]
MEIPFGKPTNRVLLLLVKSGYKSFSINNVKTALGIRLILVKLAALLERINE